jgi:hypothetical protein
MRVDLNAKLQQALESGKHQGEFHARPKLKTKTNSYFFYCLADAEKQQAAHSQQQAADLQSMRAELNAKMQALKPGKEQGEFHARPKLKTNSYFFLLPCGCRKEASKGEPQCPSPPRTPAQERSPPQPKRAARSLSHYPKSAAGSLSHYFRCTHEVRCLYMHHANIQHTTCAHRP